MSDNYNTPDEGPKHAVEPSKGLVLPAQWYEGFKWLTIIFLPAFSTLYFGMGKIWNLPEVENVVGSIVVLELFLGSILGVSNRNYNNQGADGSLNANVQGDQVVLSRLALPNITPEELAKKKSITIQVNPTN